MSRSNLRQATKRIIIMMKWDYYEWNYVVIFFFGYVPHKRQMDYFRLAKPTSIRIVSSTRDLLLALQLSVVSTRVIKMRSNITQKDNWPQKGLLFCVCPFFLYVQRHSIIRDKKLFIRPGDDLKISVWDHAQRPPTENCWLRESPCHRDPKKRTAQTFIQ